MSEADFIRAVIARPDDDAPRLIMADWLDEQGQGERAEFIRVQVALATSTEDATPRPAHVTELNWRRTAGMRAERRYQRLRRREQDLLTMYRDAEGWSYWTRWAPLVLRYLRGCRWSYRRGFVESVTCTAEDWMAHADAILAEQPIQEVTLTTWPKHRARKFNDNRSFDDIALEGFRGRWPGVTFTFHLPRFREERLAAVRQYVGNHYSEEGTRETVPVNQMAWVERRTP